MNTYQERPKTPSRQAQELVDTNGELDQHSQNGNNHFTNEQQEQMRIQNMNQDANIQQLNGYPQQDYNSPQMQYIQNPNIMPKYPKAPAQFSPQKLSKNHYLFQQLPLHRAPWNERFYLSTVLNNAKSYPFYKEYFDKPTRQTNEIMLKPTKPDIPIEEFYRSSSLAQILYDSLKHNGKLKRRVITQSSLRNSPEKQQQRPYTVQSGSMRGGLRSKSQHNLLVQEFNWVDKFNVMNSKNNVKVHNNFREFFDRPIEYDQRGYLYAQKDQPMKVYEKTTPIYESLKEVGSQKFLQRTLQNEKHWEFAQGIGKYWIKFPLDCIHKVIDRKEIQEYLEYKNWVADINIQ